MRLLLCLTKVPGQESKCKGEVSQRYGSEIHFHAMLARRKKPKEENGSSGMPEAKLVVEG